MIGAYRWVPTNDQERARDRDLVRHMVEWMPSLFDADEVHRLFDGMQPIDELLRQSGHYSPASTCPTTPTSRPS